MLASKFVAARALVLLGCGRIARRHARAARRLGIPLLAASRDAGRARAFAREFAAVDAFGTYEDAVRDPRAAGALVCTPHDRHLRDALTDRKSTRLNSSHLVISYAVFCLKKKKSRKSLAKVGW